MQKLLVVFVSLFALPVLHAQGPGKEDHVRVRLVPDVNAIVPGKPFTMAVELIMDPGWHTYWEFGGDSGLPTSISWNLPEGFQAGPVQWPFPEKIVVEGDIVTYGYENRAALLVQLTPPATLPQEDAIKLSAKVSWLVCREICLPGKAEIEMNMPVSDANQPDNEELFFHWRSLLPKPLPQETRLSWKREESRLLLTVDQLADITDFFPLPNEDTVINHVKRIGDVPAVFEIPLMDAPKDLASMRGILITGKGPQEKAWQVENSEKPAAAPSPSTGGTSVTSAEPQTQTTPQFQAPAPPGLLHSLLLGFLGGLILNIMPCVFPVLAIKIYGFVQQGHSKRSEIFRLGLAFSAGVFTWFIGLALFSIAVRNASGSATYSEQFQNPYFLLTLCALLLLFALNFMGVYEVMLPRSAENAAARASGHSGLAGAYLQGIFVTVLGTSCTAPFLGAALTVALTQAAPITLAMFVSIATGMSLPYLLLSAFPAWTKYLPKPGTWMLIFKQSVGFIMLAFLLWLLTVIGYQKGLDGLFAAALFLLCLTIACWIYGLFQQPGHSVPGRVAAFLVAFFFLLGGGFYFIGSAFSRAAAPSSLVTLDRTTDGIPWEPFTPEIYSAALQSGRIVYVDFTAKWCMTCLSNKKLVLETETIRNAFRENNILPIEADYTSQNPEIKKLLHQFGKVGVPLNVIFPANRPQEAIILPELLTQKVVLDAIERARSLSNQVGEVKPVLAEPLSSAAGQPTH